MFGRLLALFIIVPFVELFILIRIGQAIDVWFTLGIIIVTGYLGATLARRQGRAVLAQLKAQLSAGQLPASSATDGVLILIAGAFLITPGLLTDAAGFLLLLPPVRARIRAALQESFRAQLGQQVSAHFGAWPPGFGPRGHGPAAGDVIDIEPDSHRADAPPKPSAQPLLPPR
jgi:UPF0716 protein FxsA